MLKPGDVANFETLKLAFTRGEAALMACTNIKGEYVAVICAVYQDEETKEIVMTPLARMFEGNPYEEVRPLNDELQSVSTGQ